MNRVAVTGIGAICGLGNDISTIWGNAIEGKSGVSKIEHTPNIANLPVQFGGEVKNFTIAENILAAKEANRYDKFIHFALHATYEAMKNAGLIDNKAYAPERMGSIMGVGMGGFPFIEDTHKTYLEKGSRRVSPFFIPGIIPNMAPGMATLVFNLKGVNYSVSSACASAGHALSAAAFEIMLGRQDVMVTGGAESVLSDLTISGFSNMKALSKRSEEPAKASRPWDRDRDGFVLGEGSGILILENLEKAKARGATILAEVVGHGSTSDAFHITAPHEDGEGAGRCMRQSLEQAGIAPEAIGYINAHGTSTPLGDLAETKAVKNTFKEHAYKLNVSSTKSMTGHLLGAAGGIESIFCVMALHKGIIPPTINLDNQDPECDLNYTANVAKKIQVEYALNNSFGFGGTNSSLIFKHYK